MGHQQPECRRKYSLGRCPECLPDRLSSATTAAETISTSVASVPEPSAFSLLVVGLGGLIALRRVRRTA
ncbi:MAG: PEP-CTERM sorting domain-containing protein [Verrucomicrobia bacterium]|nr:PEP-CTERM sorting domain-containing protein [Verrucomicrobiota bacterium]